MKFHGLNYTFGNLQCFINSDFGMCISDILKTGSDALL